MNAEHPGARLQGIDITHSRHGSSVLLSVSGELDLDTHVRLREQIRELLMAGPADIVLDLTHTTFIDSVALGTLIGARRRSYGLRGGLTVILGDGPVARVFELTGLGNIFTTYETLEQWQAANVEESER